MGVGVHWGTVHKQNRGYQGMLVLEALNARVMENSKLQILVKSGGLLLAPFPVAHAVPPLGVSDTDRQAHGSEELLGEELGGCGNPGLHLYHLLRQDRDPHAEPHDCGPHVV